MINLDFWRAPDFYQKAFFCLIFSRYWFGTALLFPKKITARCPTKNGIDAGISATIPAISNESAFIGNSLNAIQNMVHAGETSKSAKSIANLGVLVNNYLKFNQGNNYFIPLHKEIKFLTIYTDFERLRFSNRYDITLKVANNVDTNIEIPPMLIQPFVENAIKHGLEKKVGNGKVDIHIYQKENILYCKIEDDGIGIENTKTNENSHENRGSLSFELIKERLKNLKKDQEIDLTIESINPDDPIKPGTCVTLKITIDDE